MIDSLEPLMELCKALNIPTLMLKGFEADDVIGSMAKRCAGEGLDVYMVTPDKDYGQLIEPHIWQYKPGKGGFDNEIIGVKEVCEKYGIQSPGQVIDMRSLNRFLRMFPAKTGSWVSAVTKFCSVLRTSPPAVWVNLACTDW